jgi:hypothetical protein
LRRLHADAVHALRHDTVRLDGLYTISHSAMPPQAAGLPSTVAMQFLMPWDQAAAIRDCWRRREPQRLTVEFPGGVAFVGTVLDIAEVPMIGAELQQSVLLLLEGGARLMNVDDDDSSNRETLEVKAQQRGTLPVRFYANGREFAVRRVGFESEPEYIETWQPTTAIGYRPPVLVVEFLDADTARWFATIAHPRTEWRCDFANGKSRSGRGVATMMADDRTARISHGPPAISHGDGQRKRRLS